MGWDATAAAHVEEIAQSLRRTGAATALAQQIGAVWRENLDRYEPGALGDTVRLLGQMCAENLASRMMQERDRWRTYGIDAQYPSNSLLLTFQGRRLHVVKVPQADGRHPDWSAFHWSSASNVRLEAARANAQAYSAPHIEQGLEPLFDAQQAGFASFSADGVDEFFVVWAGDLHSDALTSGWLGAPSLGHQPWLAVTELWRDVSDAATRSNEPAAEQPRTDEAEEPDVQIRLRPAAIRRPS